MYYEDDDKYLLGPIEDMDIDELRSITPEQFERLDEFDQFQVKYGIEKHEEEVRDRSIKELRSRESLSTSLRNDVNNTSNRKITKKEKWIPEYRSKSRNENETGIQKMNNDELLTGLTKLRVNKIEFNSKLNLISKLGTLFNWLLFIIGILSFVLFLIDTNKGYLINVSILSGILWIVSLITFSVLKYKNVKKAYKDGRYDNYINDTLGYIYPTLIELDDFGSSRRMFIKGLVSEYGFVNRYELAIANSLILDDYIKVSVDRGLESTLPSEWISNFRSKKKVEKLEIPSFGAIVTAILALLALVFIVFFLLWTIFDRD